MCGARQIDGEERAKGAAICRGDLVGLGQRWGSGERGEALDASMIRVRRAQEPATNGLKRDGSPHEPEQRRERVMEEREASACMGRREGCARAIK